MQNYGDLKEVYVLFQPYQTKHGIQPPPNATLMYQFINSAGKISPLQIIKRSPTPGSTSIVFSIPASELMASVPPTIAPGVNSIWINAEVCTSSGDNRWDDKFMLGINGGNVVIVADVLSGRGSNSFGIVFQSFASDQWTGFK